VKAAAPDSATRVAADPGVRAFAAAFAGEAILPGDADYDRARRVWNGMIDRRPAVIARCADVRQVADVLALARRSGLPLAVRGGGHNVAGYGTCDGGVVLDLSPMRRVEVDPSARTATVQGGATWADVDEATQRHGLATPGGEVSATGVAGLTLSGGYGMLRRQLGLTCDNLLAVEVVTADGRVVRADENEHSDLLWACRGGGGNFGVVTRFTFRLHPVGPKVFRLTVAYPAEEAPTVLRAWRAFTDDAPDEATTAAFTWRVPEAPDVPAELHGRRIVVVEGMYAGSADDGERCLAPLRTLAEPLFDLSGPVDYLEAQHANDDLAPDGGRYYWKSLQLDALGDEAIDAVIAGAARGPAGASLVVLRHLGGAIARVPESATAYGRRSAAYNLSIDAIWTDPSEDDDHLAWVRGFWAAMRPHASGVYLNFAGFGEEGTALVRSGHGANLERLRRVKRRYDPHNLFRLNPNVRPEEDTA
jgi:FAD/FMN-containing dehydrogenase